MAVRRRARRASARLGQGGELEDTHADADCREFESLSPIGLHESRHSFASMYIAAMSEAGKFNAKKLSYFMGHSSIKTTFDLYGHLLPGSEREEAGHLDVLLDRADTAQRIDQLEGAES